MKPSPLNLQKTCCAYELTSYKATRKLEILQSSLARANKDYEDTRAKFTDMFDEQQKEAERWRRCHGETEMQLMKARAKIKTLTVRDERREGEMEKAIEGVREADGRVEKLRAALWSVRKANERLWGEVFKGEVMIAGDAAVAAGGAAGGGGGAAAGDAAAAAAGLGVCDVVESVAGVL